MEKLLQYFMVKIIQVKDADLAFEIFYIGDNVIGACLMDGKFIFVHSELYDHFQELLALGGYGNSTVCPAEKLYPDFLFQFPDCGR